MTKKRNYPVKEENRNVFANQEKLISDLRETVAHLEREAAVMNYRIDAMSDMARFNIAGGLLVGLVDKNGTMEEGMLEQAYAMADQLATYYVDIMQAKAYRFQALQEQQAEDAALAKLSAAMSAQKEETEQ